jgi:hypothetical protein
MHPIVHERHQETMMRPAFFYNLYYPAQTRLSCGLLRVVITHHADHNRTHPSTPAD